MTTDTKITDAEFLERCHALYAEKAALGYEEARACAEATTGVWIEDGRDGTPEEAVDADLEQWTDDGDGQ